MLARTRLACLACVLLLAPAARAQSRDRATAEALFRAGREAAEHGDFATACARFNESNRLDPAPGTVFNLGDCNEKIGKLASAWQRYQEVIQKLPPSDPRVTVAQQHSAALEARVPHLTLRLGPGASSDASVSRDGVELGRASFGLPLPVDPGDHTVTVSAPGRAEKRYSVSLREGESRDLAVEPGAPLPVAHVASPTSTTPARDRGTDDGSGMRTAGYVALGVGAAGIVTSLITGAMVISRKNVVDNHCQNQHCDQQGLDAADAGRTLSTVSTVSFIVGAVGVGGGLTLILTHGPHETAMVGLGGKF